MPQKSSGPLPRPKPSKSTHTPSMLGDDQLLLDVFSLALGSTLCSVQLPALIQTAKTALFRRDFAAAFATPELVEAYAARWSPTRALAYAVLLSETLAPPLLPAASAMTVLALGGGGAEVAAAAALLHRRANVSACHLVLVDQAPWETVVVSLLDAVSKVPPTINLTAACHCADILSLSEVDLATHLSGSPVLITLLFTLNELYASAGVGLTTAFLIRLSHAAPAGALLMIVDSPGSYAETAVGPSARRYPMAWLLDHVLLDPKLSSWEKLDARDSEWFRLPRGYQYPIALEDMRYQMHLYRAQGLSNVKLTTQSVSVPQAT